MTLPSPGTPLKLADGRVVDPSTGRIVRQLPVVAVPSGTQAQQMVMRTQRKLAELPAVPRTMNTLSVILTYELFGLPASEIAVALDLTVRQVQTIQKLADYIKMRSEVIENVRKSEQESVQSILVQGAKQSAERHVELLNSNDEKVALAAAKSILDRTGHTEKQVIEHRHQLSGGLTINVIERAEVNEVPAIDINAKDITSEVDDERSTD